jgi:hypothetical protein
MIRSRLFLPVLAGFIAFARVAGAQTAQHQTLPTPGLVGLPYPNSAVANNPAIPIDPNVERAALSRMRVQNYRRMVKDSSSLLQLSAELRRQFDAPQTAAATGTAAAPPAPDAVAISRKLQKLSAEIDRLMRDQ